MADEQDTTPTSPPNEEQPPPTGPTPEQRQGVLYRRLDELACLDRLHIRHQGPFLVVFSTGQRVNHLLHAVLMLGSFGLWGIIWLILSWRGGERWTVMSVDTDGGIHYAPVPTR